MDSVRSTDLAFGRGPGVLAEASGHLVLCKFCNKFLNEASCQRKKAQGRTILTLPAAPPESQAHHSHLQRAELQETGGKAMWKETWPGLYFLLFLLFRTSSFSLAPKSVEWGHTLQIKLILPAVPNQKQLEKQLETKENCWKLEPCYSIDITWELVRNVAFRLHPRPTELESAF